MAPKKGKKISLNEFLGDSGSWADEMDSLPNAPAIRTDEELARSNDRYGRRDDFMSSRPDRGSMPPREDLPLPTQPPFTAFIGNLAFDLVEMELEEFFGSSKTKSIKIIKDREDKPKGFGYIEFVDLEGLKDALAKSGSSFSGRTIRVSVAEPPKERPGFGAGFDDEAKFDNPWRRDGPLPDLPDSRDSSRRRFDTPPSGDRVPSSLAEGPSDWRSSRPARLPATDPEGPTFKRKGSGFSTPDGQVGAADKEETWTIGSKFKPTPSASAEDGPNNKFGSLRGRGEMGPPKEPPADDVDWRSAAKPRPVPRSSVSPTSSTPPTPQLSRRKLELLPRSGSASVSSSPLSSPKIGPTPPVTSTNRSSPFGAARPVDVTSREKEVAERVEKDREATKDRLTHSMSRTSSRTASERSPLTRTRTPPPALSTPQTPTSPKLSAPPPKLSGPPSAANVRPSLSFANVAAKKEGTVEKKGEVHDMKGANEVEQVAEKIAEVAV